jgi:methylthioribose-1-phosphate isomerase
MKVEGKDYTTIWLKDEDTISIIDQRYLPHSFVVEDICTADEMVIAIRDMHVRGAGLIGASAGYGMYLAVKEALGLRIPEEHIQECARRLVQTRPTAVNLEWAVNRQLSAIAQEKSGMEKLAAAKKTAIDIAEEDIEYCRSIGLHGLALIQQIAERKEGPVQILTHCNAGWLAFVDHGTATAPIYEAFKNGIDIHVWVDETRPRNQGASLTAWELLNQGVPHTVIADNTGGHLMQHGMVDLVITGADRVTRKGDAANKIGTYLKALAAKDNQVPFYVAFPSSTFDWKISDGIKEIEIEERSGDEVKYMQGWCEGSVKTVLLTPPDSPVVNYGFDVTPGRLIAGLITERGICEASENSILKYFPECR